MPFGQYVRTKQEHQGGNYRLCSIKFTNMGDMMENNEHNGIPPHLTVEELQKLVSSIAFDTARCLHAIRVTIRNFHNYNNELEKDSVNIKRYNDGMDGLLNTIEFLRGIKKNG
ncbi:hypothetical protein FKW31_03075 [Acetobacter sp. DmW_136]|uniref:hypothetical protein n=1 Tax=Acetobacter sp. DmW_136 TaxID=2591091 RepID=UPI00123B46D0|nr:hypothetical protein [Acetobacter sp. DmW_136]KAA8387642.1 hypothetical protein FKW31_03075 [Acetobacter sp. DmW_136]